MDVETCEIRLIEAAWTLQCLPDPDARYRKPYNPAWPEYVLDYEEIKNRHTPSAREISRYEEALGWLQTIPIIRERKFMFHAFLDQRGRKKYSIKWSVVRKKAGFGASNYSCRILYHSWVYTMSARNI